MSIAPLQLRGALAQVGVTNVVVQSFGQKLRLPIFLSTVWNPIRALLVPFRRQRDRRVPLLDLAFEYHFGGLYGHEPQLMLVSYVARDDRPRAQHFQGRYEASQVRLCDCVSARVVALAVIMMIGAL